jgi:hypothetical protein
MIAQYNGNQIEVNAGDEITVLLDELGKPSRGQFAFITGHVSGLNDKSCLKPHVSNMLMIANPRYERYLKRMKNAIEMMTAESFVGKLSTTMFDRIAEKLENQTISELFEICKVKMLSDIYAKLFGDFHSASAEAHDTCYCNVNGWKCHLITSDTKVGGKVRKAPVYDTNGLMTIQSVILPFYCIKRWTTDAGVWKPVNSAPATLVKRAIEKQTEVSDWKVFSIQKHNYSRLAIQGAVILNEIQSSNASYPVESECHPIAAQVIGDLPDLPDACIIAEAQTGIKIS